jgi:hypothetical protein
VGACVLSWAIWIVRNDFIFNKKKVPILYAGYSFSYPLDPYVVPFLASGGAQEHGYWVQTFDDGYTGIYTAVLEL